MIDEEKLDSILMELGHCEGIRGTKYIRIAVLLYRDGMSMTKELYPAIAKECGTTPTRVERCIRHSVEKAWLWAPLSVQKKYFGNATSPESGRPVNRDYIARLAYLCRKAEN